MQGQFQASAGNCCPARVSKQITAGGMRSERKLPDIGPERVVAGGTVQDSITIEKDHPP
jgi:hypothetical protein